MQKPLFVRIALALTLAAGCSVSAAPDNGPVAQPQVQAQIRPTIRSLETGAVVEAMFNPKELTIDKRVPWQKHKNAEGDAPTLEFTAAEPRTMNVELLFDMFEEKLSVAPVVGKLEQLAMIDKGLERPPLVEFSWGPNTFRGVIARVNVKYTMFLPDGTPVRAVANVRFKEASGATARRGGDPIQRCRSDDDCPRKQRCEGGLCVDR